MSSFFKETNPEINALILRHESRIKAGKVDLMQIVSNLGITVIEEDLGISGRVCGCLVRDGLNAIILVNQYINNQGRRHFTIAHELGHYCISSHIRNMYECDKFKLEDYASKDEENEANIFASELLLPSKEVKELLERKPVSLGLIQAVANDYEMSVSAVAVKFTKLTREDTCASVLTKDDTVVWRMRSPRFFRKGLDIKTKVHSSPSLKAKSHPAQWLIGRDITEIPHVLEESIVFPNLQMKLSIITVPDSDEDDDWDDNSI